MKKFLPEGAFILFGVLGVAATTYTLATQDPGSVVFLFLSIGIGVFAAVRLSKRLKGGM